LKTRLLFFLALGIGTVFVCTGQGIGYRSRKGGLALILLCAELPLFLMGRKSIDGVFIILFIDERELTECNSSPILIRYLSATFSPCNAR
jgi:hypothetical protein